MLSELDVLVLDCQATGATPAHGDLLELGWAVCGSGAAERALEPRSYWISPKSERGVSSVVRKLTGWTDDCIGVAVDAGSAWTLLHADATRARDASAGAFTGVPTVIHFARFELPFLRELHAQADVEPFPFDTVCLHAIAQRLFPDLPRRNLRALAGHLGHSPELVRRSAGHVAATAFIWRAIVPRLAEVGVRTWQELKAWLEEPAPSSSRARGGSKKRVFPMPVERRRALPDAPGVYRFLRPNGDVLYVGKAASLKKRVASHFTAASRTTQERALEMLSQAHDVAVTETETPLEAALLEVDEIKRIAPPYNVQLRAGDRQAWFASLDWARAEPACGDCSVGPLPSSRALSSIAAMRALLDGVSVTGELRARVLGVPPSFAPDDALFDEVWEAFAREVLSGTASSRTRILRAARGIVVEESDDAGAEGWDAPRVRRALERSVASEGLLVDRARALSLLSSSVVAFREPRAKRGRLLVIDGCEIVTTADVEGALHAAVMAVSLPTQRPPPRRVRHSAFDAARYDRLRVLATELRRVVDTGGAVAVRVGAHAHGSPSTTSSLSSFSTASG